MPNQAEAQVFSNATRQSTHDFDYRVRGPDDRVGPVREPLYCTAVEYPIDRESDGTTRSSERLRGLHSTAACTAVMTAVESASETYAETHTVQLYIHIATAAVQYAYRSSAWPSRIGADLQPSIRMASVHTVAHAPIAARRPPHSAAHAAARHRTHSVKCTSARLKGSSALRGRRTRDGPHPLSPLVSNESRSDGERQRVHWLCIVAPPRVGNRLTACCA